MMLVLTQIGIDACRLLNLLARWLDPNGHIPDYIAVLAHGGRIGKHPIEIAIFAAVFHHPGPRQTFLQCRPQIGKSFRRHIRMSHQVVRRPDQLLLGKTANPDKILVDISQPPLQISGRQNRLPII